MRSRAEVHSVHDLMEESRRQGRRAAKALEDASATRSVLLPRLRDAQVRARDGLTCTGCNEFIFVDCTACTIQARGIHFV